MPKKCVRGEQFSCSVERQRKDCRDPKHTLHCEAPARKRGPDDDLAARKRISTAADNEHDRRQSISASDFPVDGLHGTGPFEGYVLPHPSRQLRNRPKWFWGAVVHHRAAAKTTTLNPGEDLWLQLDPETFATEPPAFVSGELFVPCINGDMRSLREPAYLSGSVTLENLNDVQAALLFGVDIDYERYASWEALSAALVDDVDLTNAEVLDDLRTGRATDALQGRLTDAMQRFDKIISCRRNGYEGRIFTVAEPARRQARTYVTIGRAAFEKITVETVDSGHTSSDDEDDDEE